MKFETIRKNLRATLGFKSYFFKLILFFFKLILFFFKLILLPSWLRL